MAKSDQQTLQDRTRQWESLNLLRQQNQVLRQEKDEATARLKECEKFRLKVEMDRLKQMNQ